MPYKDEIKEKEYQKQYSLNNRQKKAEQTRKYREDLKVVNLQRHQKPWSDAEKEYLEDNWGVKTLFGISRQLCRTEKAVHAETRKLRLGASTKADEYLTASQVAKLLNVRRRTVYYWIQHGNLKARHICLVFKRKFWMIRHENLWGWLEKNQDRFDSRKINEMELGYEPQWFQQKRLNDQMIPNRNKRWTTLQVQQILVNKGMDLQDIADLMGRTYNSIKMKFSRLNGVNGFGFFILKRKVAVKKIRKKL